MSASVTRGLTVDEELLSLSVEAVSRFWVYGMIVMSRYNRK